MTYGVATISRLLKIIGLFCRVWSLLQGSFAKETQNFKEPTHLSFPISRIRHPMGLRHPVVYVYECSVLYGSFAEVDLQLKASSVQVAGLFRQKSHGGHPLQKLQVSFDKRAMEGILCRSCRSLLTKEPWRVSSAEVAGLF